jgi:mono/diheme cytochrome c family protein
MSADLMRPVRRYGALVFVVSLGACSWFTDFKEQPKIDPWESPNDTIPFRGNPQSSVPVYGSFAPGYAVSRERLPATIDSMRGIANPVPADARSLLNGQKNFQINCAVCHGEAGKGDGPATKYGMPGIALATPGANAMVNLSDGYIWGMIRNGRGLMPSYNRIEEMDRWDVVNYIRGLQGRYQVGIGPVGLPGETGDKVPGYTVMGPTRPSPYYHHAGSQAGPALPVAGPGAAPSTSPTAGERGASPPAAQRPDSSSPPKAPAGAARQPVRAPSTPPTTAPIGGDR